MKCATLYKNSIIDWQDSFLGSLSDTFIYIQFVIYFLSNLLEFYTPFISAAIA